MIYNAPTYYAAREALQLKLAAQSPSPEIAAIHRDLAVRYAKLAQIPAQRDGMVGPGTTT